jgi:hypothetical protein
MAKEDEIRVIAYQIWEQEGCCDGRDLEHWIRAEIVWTERQKPAKPAKPAGKSTTANEGQKAAAKTAQSGSASQARGKTPAAGKAAPDIKSQAAGAPAAKPAPKTPQKPA